MTNQPPVPPPATAEQIRTLRAAIRIMLDSAHPHPVEHKAMTKAWEIGRAALADTDCAAPASPTALSDVLTDEALAAEFGSVKISPPGLRARVMALVGAHEQSLRDEIDRLQAEAQEFSDRPAVACEDCGLAYDRFPMDVVLSDAQWMAIHPENDGNGQLCGRCIVERGKRRLNPIIAVLRFVDDTEHEHFRRTKNAWSFASYAALRLRLTEAEQRIDMLVDNVTAREPWVVIPIGGHSVAGHGNSCCFWCGENRAEGHIPGCLYLEESASRPVPPAHDRQEKS